MSKNQLDPHSSPQKRSARLLTGMAVFVLLGALAYLVLSLLANRRVPVEPDTRYTADNGVAVYYDSGVWPVCRMTEDSAQGWVLELASGEDSDDDQYQVVLLQRGDEESYEDFLAQSQEELRASYGTISPRSVSMTVEGATVEAVRCDCQIYYAVLATVTYDSGDVVYVSALTKLASIGDIVNLVESVTLA